MRPAATAAPPDRAAGTDQPVQASEGWRGRRFGVGVLALAVLASLLVGYAVAALALRPEPTPDDGSAEAGFARDMITHHTQAVTMGMEAYRRAADPEVRRLGYDLAMIQQGEIGMMHQWLREWQLSPTGSEPQMAWMQEDLDPSLIRSGRMPGLATPEQMDALRAATGSEVDRLFLELMTYHHLGGLHMIDGVLDRTDHPEVSWLAEQMQGAQQRELAAMRDLQAQLDQTGEG